jgi:RimJ/RimL family protein N-acetyltransferase
MSKTRVRLIPFDRRDIPRFMELSHDPELVATMGWRPFGPDEEERFVATMNVLSVPYAGSGPPIVFGIHADGVNRTIGYVCLKGIDDARDSAELGIAIMEKEYRNLGYGTEAVRLAIRYAFETLGLELVGLTVFPENIRALVAYQKAGFNKAKLLEKAWLQPDGNYVDILLMELRKAADIP